MHMHADTCIGVETTSSIVLAHPTSAVDHELENVRREQECREKRFTLHWPWVPPRFSDWRIVLPGDEYRMR